MLLVGFDELHAPAGRFGIEQNAGGLPSIYDPIALNTAERPLLANPLVDEDPDAEEGTAMDPIARWNALVAAKVETGMPKSAAIKAVVRENPQAHTDFVKAYNEQHRPQRPF